MKQITYTTLEIIHFKIIETDICDTYDYQYQDDTIIYDGLTFNEVIQQKIPKSDFQKWSMYYYNCNCCTRHQLNKSVIIINQIHTKNRQLNGIPINFNCQCICRQIGRRLSELSEL